MNPLNSSLKMIDSRFRGNDIRGGGNDREGKVIIFLAMGRATVYLIKLNNLLAKSISNTLRILYSFIAESLSLIRR